MAIGSELDKQIYKEGSPTWGCKSGVLDVEDVRKSIKELQVRFKKVSEIENLNFKWINCIILETFGIKLTTPTYEVRK